MEMQPKSPFGEALLLSCEEGRQVSGQPPAALQCWSQLQGAFSPGAYVCVMGGSGHTKPPGSYRTHPDGRSELGWLRLHCGCITVGHLPLPSTFTSRKPYPRRKDTAWTGHPEIPGDRTLITDVH